MGRPKLLLPWCGTTVVGHLIGQWQELKATQIAIVIRRGDALLDGELDRLGFARANRIVNPQPKSGMFSSIQCAADWPGWQAGLGAWALVLGDQPHLKNRTLRDLLDFHDAHRLSICQPEYAGRARHPVILPGTAFAELKQSQAGTLRRFLQQSRHSVKLCPINDPGLALDLDRPEDYQAAQGAEGTALPP
jgi:molybdenum cofactor cytidylyltransferase